MGRPHTLRQAPPNSVLMNTDWPLTECLGVECVCSVSRRESQSLSQQQTHFVTVVVEVVWLVPWCSWWQVITVEEKCDWSVVGALVAGHHSGGVCRWPTFWTLFSCFLRFYMLFHSTGWWGSSQWRRSVIGVWLVPWWQVITVEECVGGPLFGRFFHVF